MKVAEFQQTLRQVAALVESTGSAKSQASELRAFADGIEKFKDQTLGAFTTLLGRVNEQGDTAPKPTKSKNATVAKTPAETAEVVAAEAKRLYAHAAQGIDEKELISLRDRLTRLTGESLKVVAKELNFTPTSKEKAKANLVDALIRKIEKREGATIRRNVIDRPEGHPSTPPPAPATAPVS